MAHLLIIDDEASICWAFRQFGRTEGHSVATAASAEEGLKELEKESPDMIFLDVRLPGIDGLTAMGRLEKIRPGVPIVIMTAFGQLETAIRAVRQGALDYLAKPFDLEEVRTLIEQALAEKSPTDSLTPVTYDTAEGEPLLGSSPEMQKVFKKIALATTSDACVHLFGESGTGKELVARAIHHHSHRKSAPFVAINLASLNPALAESALFGHEKGAFTSAEQKHQGLLKKAEGGTVFLDEIAEMPEEIQIKLLRALEHGEFFPVGANRPMTSDFRILSATHRDLLERVQMGDFRHDLFFRLNTLTIELPPLRRRLEDLPMLVSHFLSSMAQKNRLPLSALSEQAMEELRRRNWHGNVRELRNAIEYAMIHARKGTILPYHLPPPIPSVRSSPPPPEYSLSESIRRWTEEHIGEAASDTPLQPRFLEMVERPFLEQVMAVCGGNCAEAARKLGIHRTTLRNKLAQYGILDDE